MAVAVGDLKIAGENVYNWYKIFCVPLLDHLDKVLPVLIFTEPLTTGFSSDFINWLWPTHQIGLYGSTARVVETG